MRRLEEDSEVYKMLQENRELRAAPRQSSTFRLLQEALEDEGGGEGGPEGRWGGPAGGNLTALSPRSLLPQPTLAQRPQTRGWRPEAARLREMRQHHRVSGAEGRGGGPWAGSVLAFAPSRAKMGILFLVTEGGPGVPH